MKTLLPLLLSSTRTEEEGQSSADLGRVDAISRYCGGAGEGAEVV